MKKFPYYLEFKIQAGQVIAKRNICLLNSNLCISLINNPNVMTRWTMCPVYVERDSAIKILEIKRSHQVKLLGISYRLLLWLDM